MKCGVFVFMVYNGKYTLSIGITNKNFCIVELGIVCVDVHLYTPIIRAHNEKFGLIIKFFHRVIV